MLQRRVVFPCAHNSARSQRAEAWLRALGGDRFEVASAGTDATGVHPIAVRAMAEIGVDVAGRAVTGHRALPPRRSGC